MGKIVIMDNERECSTLKDDTSRDMKLLEKIAETHRDKILLFLAGVIIGCIFGITLRMGAAAAVPAVFAGAAKEMYDAYKYGRPNWIDFLCTALGGLFVSLCFVFEL